MPMYFKLWKSIGSKNIKIEAYLEDQRKIYLDEELMKLAWNNLISNAIKFTEENGTIFVKQYVEDN